jgi:sodium pump decarboxylase gamma subunit
MLLNLLADPFRSVDIGEAALYALLGFLIVFGGISFLIFVVWLVGKIISPVKATKTAVKTKETVQETLATTDAATGFDDVDEETLAVITAALMAYYQTNNPKCEFTLKRIKRI